MNIRRLRLAQSAIHWPARVVTAVELDARFGLPAGWTEEKTGVVRRRFIEPGRDTNASMGAAAVRQVLDAAGLDFADVDLLVNASGSIQQPIPCTAALIQRELGEAAAASGVPCLDLNATCLSFLLALEFAGAWLAARGGGRVLIVSSEIASQGVDWSDPHSACLFGDGAAAFLLEHDPAGAESGLLASRFETFSEGAEHCEVRGGAQGQPPWTYAPERHRDFVFRMDGPAVHRLAAKRLPGLVERVLADAGLRIDELAAVVPHQAGVTPMRLIERRLGLTPGKMVFTLAEHGNLIAASIPTALHLARKSGRVRAGDRVLFLGTAAGYAQGAMVWQL